MARMTKAAALRYWREHMKPGIPANDKPARRLSWNEYVDRLEREQAITERQATMWDVPKECR